MQVVADNTKVVAETEVLDSITSMPESCNKQRQEDPGQKMIHGQQNSPGQTGEDLRAGLLPAAQAC